MNQGLITLAIIALAMMVIQNFLTYLQYKAFQKNAEAMRQKGRIIGVGMRKGGFNPRGGAIVILAWNQAADRVAECRRLSGIAFWNAFKTIPDYDGMTLDQVRARGIAEDADINAALREKEPYHPQSADKHRKKGALIQAVEAIDTRLASAGSRQADLGNQTVMTAEQRERVEARRREIIRNHS